MPKEPKTNKRIKLTKYKAVTGKLVDKKVTDGKTGKKRLKQIDLSTIPTNGINAISKYNADKIKASQEMLDQFPDLELGTEILVSSIISPNDLLTVSLAVKNKSNKIPVSVREKLNAVLHEELVGHYRLEEKLYDILETALVIKGAYCELFISEGGFNSIIGDAVTKVKNDKSIIALEDVISELSISDIPKTYKPETKDINSSLERLIDDNLTLSTNPDILFARDAYLEYIDSGIENLNTTNVLDKIFTDISDVPIKDIVEVKASDEVKNNTGRPLNMVVPMESVIILHAKNEPKKRLGAIILLDETGSPITTSIIDNDDFDGESKTELTTDIVAKAKALLKKKIAKEPELKEMEDIASALVNKRIARLINNKNIHELIDDRNTETIYITMFKRLMRAQKTTMLFIPKDNLSYIAFNYRANGTGKGLLESLHYITSMRAMLRMAKLHGNIKNSVTDVNYAVQLDDDDPDPEKTMEEVISMVTEGRQNVVPVGLINTPDLVDWVHKLGISFSWKHKKLPDMEIGVEERSHSYTEPESDLGDELKKNSSMKLGLSPETIDQGLTGDFATTIVANSALYAKRVMRKQEWYEYNLADYAGIVIKNDMIVANRLKAILTEDLPLIKKNLSKEAKKVLESYNINEDKIVDYLLLEYKHNCVIELPKPAKTDSDGLAEAFSKFKENMEDYIDTYLSEEAIPEEFIGTIGENIGVLKTAVVNTLLRRWMVENNYLPELANMFSVDEGGNSHLEVLSEHQAYLEDIADGILKFKKENAKKVKKNDKKDEKIDGEEDEEEETPNEGSATPEEDGITPGDDTGEDDGEIEEPKEEEEGGDETNF